MPTLRTMHYTPRMGSSTATDISFEVQQSWTTLDQLSHDRRLNRATAACAPNRTFSQMPESY